MRCFGMVLMLPLSILIQDGMNTQNEMEAKYPRWCRHAIYATLKQKAYNILTNTQNASSLPLWVFFLINKIYIVTPKHRRRQLTAKMCGSKSATFNIFFRPFLIFFFVFRTLCSTTTTQKRFSTKWMLTTVQSSTTTQRVHSSKFILVEDIHSTVWLLSVA